MSLDSKSRDLPIKHRFEKAYDAVKDVELLIEHGRFSLAVNRIYYVGYIILSRLLP